MSLIRPNLEKIRLTSFSSVYDDSPNTPITLLGAGLSRSVSSLLLCSSLRLRRRREGTGERREWCRAWSRCGDLCKEKIVDIVRS